MKILTPEILRDTADALKPDQFDFICHLVNSTTGRSISEDSSIKREVHKLLREAGVSLGGDLDGTERSPVHAQRLRFMLLEFLALYLETENAPST